MKAWIAVGLIALLLITACAQAEVKTEVKGNASGYSAPQSSSSGSDDVDLVSEDEVQVGEMA